MKKILIIEDNFEVRENLEEILMLSNYEVIKAEDGLVGVEKAVNEHPDLILCDVMMPNLDGFGVLHILSQKLQTSDIPFIFLTAKTDKSDQRMGMNLGADDYITKPFNHLELLDAIEIRLKKSERLQKTYQANPFMSLNLVDEDRGQKELEKLTQSKEPVFFHKKDLIFREGELPKRLFYVVSGKVKTYRSNNYGKEFITAMYKPGDFIGFKSLLQEKAYHESAAAMEDSKIIFIPKKEFHELLNVSRDFIARFIKIMANDIQEKEEELLKLAYNSVRKRVADALVTLIKKYNLGEEDDIHILRDDLASMVGTAKESVSRILTDFKTENLIEIDHLGIIKILDGDKLATLTN